MEGRFCISITPKATFAGCPGTLDISVSDSPDAVDFAPAEE